MEESVSSEITFKLIYCEQETCSDNRDHCILGKRILGYMVGGMWLGIGGEVGAMVVLEYMG